MTLTFNLPAWSLDLVSFPPKAAPHDPTLTRPAPYRAEPHYVYRIDYLYSYGHWLVDRIKADGHAYKIDLASIEKHRGSGLPYVEALLDSVLAMAPAEHARRAVYFWDNRYLALEFQLTHIGDFCYVEMNLDRDIVGDTVAEELCRAPIMSRVRREHLPNGLFITDLNPQLIPFGLAHVVAIPTGQSVRIPEHHIEFWYRDNWCRISDIDRHEMLEDIRRGSFRSIVPNLRRWRRYNG